MKLKKLNKKVQNFLDAGSRKRKAHREDMKKLLAKMKAKEKEKRLEAKALSQSDKKELERLHKDIHMLHAQRKKGINALKKLN